MNRIGELSQLTAMATWQDGSTRDVTSLARWQSLDPSVITVSDGGLVTASGFGAANVTVSYELLSRSLRIEVTPEGTIVVTGEVREPGQGPVAAVRVQDPVSGRFAMTAPSGLFTLYGVGGTQLMFEKDGYEPTEAKIAANRSAHGRIQRIVRIAVGETAVVPKLTHMDVEYDVGPDRCSPCRLIRIIAPSSGPIHLELSWDRDAGSDLHLWVEGERFAATSRDRRIVVDARLSTGENVVYVGFYRWTVFYGGSIAFELATSALPGN